MIISVYLKLVLWCFNEHCLLLESRIGPVSVRMLPLNNVISLLILWGHHVSVIL